MVQSRYKNSLFKMKESQNDDVVLKLEDYKKKVDKELKSFFAKQIKESREIDKTSLEVVRILEEFNLRGGKRIRAALIYYGFKCFSNEPVPKDLIKVAAAMELVQSFLLIHDDIVDRDDQRRGRASIHKIFEKIGENDFSLNKNIPEKKHFGEAMAIFLGDICFAMSNLILSEVQLENKVKVIHEINRIVRDTTFGQIIDSQSNYNEDTKFNDTLKVYELKTAEYTIEVPLKIGAILANAKEVNIRKIKKYAKPLGVAFNIQDDLLELFNENKKIGKPVGSDLKEGKKTLIILKTIERANKQQKKTIKESLGNKNLSTEKIEEIKGIMMKTGALKYCQKYSLDLISEAKKEIKNQKYYRAGEDFLLSISDYLINRNC